MNTQELTWLHLSDFHVGLDEYGQKQLFNEIIEHIQNQKTKGIVPDYVFITGDLANRGIDTEYKLFNEQFLEPLQKAIGNNIDARTFSIPGNHDVNRNKTPAFSSEKFLNAQLHYFDPTKEGLEARKAVLERFAAFSNSDITANLGEEWVNSEQGSYFFIDNQRELGIVGINTAWLCEGDNDEKRLSPGKNIVQESLDKIKNCKIKIVLGHHPLDWLHTDHRRPIEALFGKHNVIYLHGHLHEAWIAPQHGSGRPFLAIQSGAAFQARENSVYKNGLLWARLDLNSELLYLQPRSWNVNNQDWSLSEAFPDFNRDGEFWSFDLPGKKKVNIVTEKIDAAHVPAGWSIKNAELLEKIQDNLEPDVAVKFFDGAIPDWQVAASPIIPQRKIVSKICSYFRNFEETTNSTIVALIAAGCEGKSTAILQSAFSIAMSSSKWQILRRGVETNPLIPEQLIPILKGEYNWLILLDDAENAIGGIVNLLKHLPATQKGKVHFLLAARDSDWGYENSQALAITGCIFHREKLSGLIEEDAQAIVKCWRHYGEDGLGELARVATVDQVASLLNAAKRELGSQGSAFFGALLKVRYGDELRLHTKKLLDRLGTRVISTGGTLQDAFIYIAAMDSLDLNFLSRSVLAYTLKCPEEQLRKNILQPLGEEAAATTTSDYVYTRHPLIAKAVMSVVTEDYGRDEDTIYLDMVEAAMDLRQDVFVPELGSWRYKLADFFFELGRRSLAIRIAIAVRLRQPNDGRVLTKLAHLYRKSLQPEKATKLYEQYISNITEGSDRRLFEDWSISEQVSRNYANAGFIGLFSLSDQAASTPQPLDNIADIFQTLSYNFKRLYLIYYEENFRDLSFFASAFGVNISRDAEQISDFGKNVLEISGVIPESEQSVDGFINCTIDSWHLVSRYIDSEFMRQYVSSYGEITFSSFKNSLVRLSSLANFSIGLGN